MKPILLPISDALYHQHFLRKAIGGAFRLRKSIPESFFSQWFRYRQGITTTRTDVDELLDMPSRTGVVRVCTDQDIIEIEIRGKVFIIQNAANSRSEREHKLRLNVSEQGFDVSRFPEVEICRSRTHEVDRSA